MTQTLGTDQSNDIYLGPTGNIVMLTGIQAVLAACATAAKAQLAEMVLATKQGIPNFQTIWVGVPNYAIWESFLRRTLLKVGGVTNVQSIKISRDADFMRYTATIKTAFGTGTING